MIHRFRLVGAVVLLGLPSAAWSADAPAGSAAPPAFARPVMAARAPALPAPLDGLAAQVVGVVGSGDKLGLVIHEGEANRTLKLGEVYQDGWVLTTLTADVATLSKAGQTRQVGLNPDGAVAQREIAGATEVKTVGRPGLDPTMVENILQRLSANGMNVPGLDAAAMQQMMTNARDYMNTPAGQAAMATAYDRAAQQYGQGAIDRFMAQQQGGGRAGAAPGGAQRALPVAPASQ